MKCPTCGKDTLEVVIGSVLFRGIMIPNAKRKECIECGETLWSPEEIRYLEQQEKEYKESV